MTIGTKKSGRTWRTCNGIIVNKAIARATIARFSFRDSAAVILCPSPPLAAPRTNRDTRVTGRGRPLLLGTWPALIVLGADSSRYVIVLQRHFLPLSPRHPVVSQARASRLRRLTLRAPTFHLGLGALNPPLGPFALVSRDKELALNSLTVKQGWRSIDRQIWRVRLRGRGFTRVAHSQSRAPCARSRSVSATAIRDYYLASIRPVKGKEKKKRGAGALRAGSWSRITTSRDRGAAT
jgi:hypothetical protein